MPYADTDFFVALAKTDDRLHASALEAYNRYRGSIYTSLATMLELALISGKVGRRTEELIEGVLAMSEVKGVDKTQIMFAARLIETGKVGVFDAFHAALCEGNIISSDHVYDSIGIERIKLY